MTRRSGIFRAIAQAQREAERKSLAQARAQTQAAKAAAQAQKAYERAQIADQKESARLYAESRVDQVAMQNQELESDIRRLGNLLIEALSLDSFLDFQKLKEPPNLPIFNPGQLAVEESPPSPQMYLPPELTGLQKFVPGAKEKHARETTKAWDVYRTHATQHAARETVRQQNLAQAKAAFDRQIAEIQQRTAAQHAEIDSFQREFSAGSPFAIVNYFTMILTASNYPDGFPQHAKLAYVPESRQLVIEYDLPSLEIVPAVGSYKYIKARDEITEVARPQAQRKALYASVIAQVTLRTLFELFKADRTGYLDTVVLNGYVDSVDKGTGRSARICLVTVRTSRDTFTQLNLSQVDPLACLNVLNASVSKSPAELAPVRPVLEFNMVDPRFIEETDVLSELDQRPNLMELSPKEFESLITNLFQKMGLETRLTQASRDGGVDCVAFDPRPIFGRKVLIQAKRYKNILGVGAVRYLYETMQNEPK
jgi:restriction system protein